jgi:hypothetical protein
MTVRNLISLQYEFQSEANPIKLQQLRVEAFRINSKGRGISKDKSLCDTVWRQTEVLQNSTRKQRDYRRL